MTTLPELVDEVLIEALHHQAPELPPLIDKLLEAGQTKGQVKQFTREVFNVKVTPAPGLMKRRPNEAARTDQGQYCVASHRSIY
jgi:hypothetical protein